MSATADAKQTARRAASSPWAQGLARAGLVAKGLTFGLVAVLALDVAVSGSGKLQDRPAALHEVAENPFGRVLLAALAVGLAGYALWQLALAVLGRKLETGEREDDLRRIPHAARALVYGWLAFVAVDLVIDAGKPPGENHDEKELTARALDWPLGRWLVAAAGLVVVGVGLYNIYRGLSQDFRDELKEEQMKGAERRGYSVLGLIGFTARGVIFVLAGFFVVRAAWQYDPKEAAGLDGALARLAHAEYGMFLLACVAAGLLAYALFSFAQARYRKV